MQKRYIVVKHARPEEYGEEYVQHLAFLPTYDRTKKVESTIVPGVIESGEMTEEQARVVEARPHVKSVEEDVEDSALGGADLVNSSTFYERMDQLAGLMWDGMDSDARAFHQLLDAEGQGHKGRGVVVAVGDTGLRKTTEDAVFKGRVKASKSFISGETVEDGNGHGDFCCVAATPDEAQLLVGKVLSNAGSGARSGIINFISWAVQQGAHVISLSLGGGGFSQAYEDVIKAARDAGVLVFCAAGNGGRENEPVNAPANSPSAIPVAATDYRTGRVADFSCKGAEMSKGFAGSGVRVMYDPPGSPPSTTMSGTSMATPVVARCYATVRSNADMATSLHAITQTVFNHPDEPPTSEGNGVPKVADALKLIFSSQPIPPPPDPVRKKKYQVYGWLYFGATYMSAEGKQNAGKWGEIDKDGNIKARDWDDPGDDA